MRAVTGDVVSQPPGVRWAPESFSLRFAENAKAATYECNSGGRKYVADLSAQAAAPVAKRPSSYKGTIRPSNVPIAIDLDPDRKSGTMTQSSKSGQVVVKFTAVGDNALLRAVTDEIISKPENVRWQPESFTLRFDESGERATYECISDGKTYSADLTPP